MPDSSRLWVYAADRVFSAEEEAWINENIQQFLLGWNNHGKELTADGKVFENRFIVFTVNEAMVNASGCSIDSSVRFVKEIGTALKINFFDRLNLWVKSEDSFNRVHLSDLGANADANLFNPMIANLGEFRNAWLIPVADSILLKQMA